MRELILFINDILDSILSIEKYIKNKSREEFLENEMLQDAVVRKFEIVGEATKNIPKEFREKYPQILWKELAGLRDILIHSYFGADIERVWAAIEKDLPKLKENISKIIKEEENKKQIQHGKKKESN